MTAADIARLDVPVSVLEQDMKALVERQRDLLAAEVLLEALAHPKDHGQSDLIAYRLDLRIIAHPEAVSTPGTYAEWSAQLEQRIADEKAERLRRTS